MLEPNSPLNCLNPAFNRHKCTIRIANGQRLLLFSYNINQIQYNLSGKRLIKNCMWDLQHKSLNDI